MRRDVDTPGVEKFGKTTKVRNTFNREFILVQQKLYRYDSLFIDWRW
jgi:hypothetical protein